MIIVRNVTNDIMKKMLKLISHYHYGVVVYGFMHIKKRNIKSLYM